MARGQSPEEAMARRRRKKKQKPAPPQGATPAERSPAPAATRSTPRPGPRELSLVAAILANLLILAFAAYAAVLEASYPDFYYLSVQEDEYLEWGTFWAFMGAAAAFVVAAVGQRRTEGKVPWFLAGVALFCFTVAMEEISWGQRVASYRPPDYFLEHNFQQELNVHNVISTKLRKLAVKTVIVGYGVVLPVLFWVPAVRRLLERLAVVAPPWQLIPSFYACFWLFDEYPWKFTGEWVETMLGLGFLFAALAHVHAWRTPAPEGGRIPRHLRLPAAIALSWLLVSVIGVATAVATHRLRGGDEEMIATTRAELEALKRDFTSGKVRTRCNRHKRLYSFMEKYRQHGLLEGEFAALKAQGLPEARAEFLLDPWNSPYWIRDRCDDDRRVTFVYSFGPNRRRESSRWEVLGDDIGVVIHDGERRGK